MSAIPMSDWQSQVLEQSPWLRRLISRQLQEPEAVEDVLQETLAAAIQREPQSADIEEFRSWLGGVARNQSRLYIRSESRKHRKHCALGLIFSRA